MHNLPNEIPSMHRLTVGEGGALPATFEHVARLFNDRPALGASRWQPTYRELNAAANRLAHALLRRAGPSEDRVAIFMQHDTPAISAVLAALKAGKIAAPLNPTHPPARLRQLMEDIEPAFIITDIAHLNLASEIAGPACAVIRIEDESRQSPDHNPGLVIGADQTACLIYTSGSTGRPKGIMRTHRQLIHNANIEADAMRFTASDRVALFASLSSAQGDGLLWNTLLSGAQLCPFPMINVGIAGLRDWMTDQQITVYVSSASIFRHFAKTLEEGTTFPLVHTVRLASEPATSDDFKLFKQHFSDRCMLVHGLWCSETSMIAVWRSLAGDNPPEGRIPIGAPSSGTEVLILDETGRPVDRGEIGEIVVKSRYLAAGYWRQPVLTAERFSGTLGGVRKFRTGDMGRINAKGQLEFAGRRDGRVRIRGNSVELSEVESALRQLPGVEQVAVDAVERDNNELVLVGYIVTDAGHSWSQARLRTELRSFVPHYMVPSKFLLLESLPRTSGGKIDRESLRERARPLLRAATSGLPATETEALMVRIWAEALELDGVGRLEDFFDLGGDSLLATVIAVRLHDMMRIDVDFAAFVEFPILKDFAAFVDKSQPNLSAPPLFRLRPTEPAPLSVVQEYYWRRSLDPIRSVGLTQAAAGRIEGPLDIDVLRQSLNDVAARHDILRTRFEAGQRADDFPIQTVNPPGDFPLPFLDFSEMSDAETRLETALNEERKKCFDLSAAPPISFKLLRLRRDCHVLLRSAHQIVTDGPSWNIFLHDLAHIYDARLRGKDPSLPPLAIQYADYSAWERARWRRGGEALRQATAWWKRELEDMPRPPKSGWLAAYMRREPAGKLSPDEWSVPWGLESDTSERLDHLARARKATYFAVRLAGVVPVCAMATGQDKVLLATVRTMRTRAELLPVFGPLVNYAPLLLRCDWNWTFRDLVIHMRQKLVDVQRNIEVPYSLLAEELKAQDVDEPRPLLLVHKKTRWAPVRIGESNLTWSDQNWHPMRQGIMVRFDEIQERDGCLTVFDARVYSTEVMREFVDCLAKFIRAAARDPDATIRSLIEADGVGDRLRKRRTPLADQPIRDSSHNPLISSCP